MHVHEHGLLGLACRKELGLGLLKMPVVLQRHRVLHGESRVTAEGALPNTTSTFTSTYEEKIIRNRGRLDDRGADLEVHEAHLRGQARPRELLGKVERRLLACKLNNLLSEGSNTQTYTTRAVDQLIHPTHRFKHAKFE